MVILGFEEMVQVGMPDDTLEWDGDRDGYGRDITHKTNDLDSLMSKNTHPGT